MADNDFRVERDSMGETRVPAGALSGAQTQRAVQNFPISGLTMPRGFIRALAPGEVGGGRRQSRTRRPRQGPRLRHPAGALEVAEGRHDAHFPVDVFQTGSGTSSNMNANEVIARLATEYAGGSTIPVHANDHVNRGQSSNDVIPTAIHLGAALALSECAVARAQGTASTRSIARQATSARRVKTGRTHLMDAMPLTLGQEMGAWRTQLEAQ